MGSQVAYAELRRVISALDLLDRWKGLTETELLRRSWFDKNSDRPPILRPYRVVKILKESSGENIFICSSNTPPKEYHFSRPGRPGGRDWTEIDWEQFCYSLKDVLEFEAKNPGVLLPMVDSGSDRLHVARVRDAAEKKSPQLDIGYSSRLPKVLKTVESPPKTQAASEARDQKTAERWKGHLSVGVKITAEIMQNGVRPYTKRELVKLCEKHGGSWGEDSAQMKALREALPSEYVSNGGAPKQDPE